MNSHTLSTLIDLYVFPHIFYVKNNPHPLSLDTDWIYIYIYIYIYIFTNLISTSIHGTRKKKPGQEQEIKVSRITAQGKK